MSDEKREIATRPSTAAAPPGFISESVQTMAGVQELAKIMAGCGTLPKHLQGQESDCFRVVAQAVKWNLDPFAVAECTSLVHGRLCFEGKLVAAVLDSMGAIKGRLDYDIEGEGQDSKITVSGTPKGDDKVRTISGSVAQWRTIVKKDGKIIPNAWDKDPHSMLVYRGTRQWARLYAPGALMGIVTDDEFDREVVKEAEVIQVAVPKPAEIGAVGAVDVEAEAEVVPQDEAPGRMTTKEARAKATAMMTAIWKTLKDEGHDPGDEEAHRLAKDDAAAIVRAWCLCFGAENPNGVAEESIFEFLDEVEQFRFVMTRDEAWEYIREKESEK